MRPDGGCLADVVVVVGEIIVQILLRSNNITMGVQWLKTDGGRGSVGRWFGRSVWRVEETGKAKENRQVEGKRWKK